MSNLINKSALVAEIEKIKHETNYEPFTGEVLGKRCACDSLLSFIDTLEVKELDFEKEIDLVEDKYHGFYSLSRADIIDVAKYFFELGISVSNKAQKGE